MMRKALRWFLILALLPVSAHATSRTEIAVTGSVTVAGGAGLGGVRIEILPFLADYRSGQLILEGRLEEQPAATALTDDAGRFDLRAPAKGLWRIVARAPGYVPMHFPTLALVAATELPPVGVQRDRGVRVRVSDASGKPAAGAWVWAETATDALWSASRSTDWTPAFRARRTDHLGLTLLPAAEAEELDITVLADGGGGTRVRSAAPDLEIQLEEANLWRWIEVRGPDRQPASDVLVRGGPLAWPFGFTGADGRLRVPIQGGKALAARVVTPAGDRQAVTIPAPGAGSVEPFVVTLREPIILGGRIIGRETRKALSGVLVWTGLDPGIFVRADRQGRYRLRAPVADRFWIQAEAPGYVPEAVWLSRQELAARRVPSLALQPAVGVRGRVVDPSGAAIPAAHLAAVERPPTKASYFRSGGAARRSQTAAAGHFELPGLARGGNYEVEVSRPGYTPAKVRLVVPEAPDPPPPLEVLMAPARGAFGRVVDAEARPLAGVDVEAAVAGRAPLSPLPPDDPRRARSDAEGRFALARLPASLVDLGFSKEGFAPMKIRGLEVPLDGADTDAIDLGSVVLVTGAGLAGRVIDDAGEGVATAAIHIVRSERPQRPGGVAEQWLLSLPPEVRSDGEGRFRLGQLTPGERIHLLVGAEGHSPEWIENLEIPASEQVTVVLAPGGGVGGRVVDADGEPVSGAEMVFEQRPGAEAGGQPSIRQALTAGDGGFRFGGLRAGPGRLTAFAPGFVPAPAMTLEVAAGEPVDDLEIRLERGAVITGRTLTHGGEAVAGVKILADRAAAVSDADGVFRLDGVPPGPTRLEARHAHHGRRIEELDVAPGINTLDILVEDGYEVRGRVHDAVGAPVAGVLVEISARRGADRRRHQAWSGADGGFRFAPVIDGVYDLRAERRDYSTAEIAERVRVAGGPVAGIEVRLEQGIEVRGEILGLDFDQLSRARVAAVDAGGGTWAGEIDYQGRYVISDLKPGDWSIRASLAAGRRETRAVLTLVPGAGSVRRDLEFRPGLVLSGQVLHNGAPLAATLVSLDGLATAINRQVRSDPSGRFRIEDLEPDSYRLGLVNAAEQLTDNRLVELEASREMLLDLRSARVGGRVWNPASSQPIAGALISLRPLAADSTVEGIRTGGSDGDGRFLLPRVPAGRYRLSASKDGSVATERELEVLGGIDTTDLELLLPVPPPTR